MTLSACRNHLSGLVSLHFQLPGGGEVPAHFHITEVGMITRHFMDCGGTVRLERSAIFQLYVAGDTGHRLSPEKLLGILSKSDRMFEGEDLEIEVEYQLDTIGKYGLEFSGGKFQLTPTYTDCLASDHCGVPQQKRRMKLAALQMAEPCCNVGSGCC